jgi:dTDP-4-amino-4,6-dideoxygalactose transaminase
LFGAAAPIDEIETLLSKKGVALMDDAAQALGVRRGDRLVGSFGACGIVACGPGKPLAGVGGGLLVTNDQALYERAAALRFEAERPGEVARRTIEFWIWRRLRRYTLPFNVLFERLAGEGREPLHINASLSNLDGGIALAQFESLESHAAARRRHAEVLVARLSSLPAQPVTDFSSGMCVKLVYVLPESGPLVGDAIEILSDHGIEAQGGYSPLHQQYTDDARLPTTASLWRRVLCVPVETGTTQSIPIPFRQLTGAPDAASIRPSRIVASV